MELVVKKNIDELSFGLAGWISAYIDKNLKEKKNFSFVLSGGTTPEKLYQLLASGEFRDKIDWTKLHFFWGDERYVPYSDERNNARMAFEKLLSHVPVKKEQVHIIQTDREPAVAAADYEKLLHRYFPLAGPTFDLVLLGMGDNAHTLSLFPGYNAVMEKKQWVRSFYLEEQQMHRITLTAPVVNAASAVVFFVSGAAKAPALQQVIEGKYDPTVYPAQVIQPLSGKLYWWVDEAAAKNLTYKK